MAIGQGGRAMAEVTSRMLLKKGAEASLFLADWHGKRVVIKARLPKKYRPEELDAAIRGYRTVHEPQLMHEAKKAGVATPFIFLVDLKNAAITMEFVEGKQVKQLLGSISKQERQKLCFKVGELIGKLHAHGVIHGDLTTSNMLLNGEGKIFLVDFGLGEKNTELEARGVDLHLMKRALQSTHYQFAEECFESVMKGYTAVFGAEEAGKVLGKIKEIEKRGRYVAERKEEA
jgi:TP53 regulating kinase-like protein